MQMPLEISLAPQQATVRWGNRREFGILDVCSLPVTGATLVRGSFFRVLEVLSSSLCSCCSQSLRGGEGPIYTSVRGASEQQISGGGNGPLNKELSRAWW